MSGPDREILIVDDDVGLRETLADFLTMEGFAVREAGHVSEARERIAAKPPDLVLLDVNMPGGGGLGFVTELRNESTLPIIMISGKGDMVDRVVGLEVGADDYLAKPFELRELLARIRAVLRRAQPPVAPEPANGKRLARFGGCFVLDVDRRSLLTARGELVELTGAEYGLLKGMVERPNRVLSRDLIADIVHHGDVSAYDRSIDTLVSRLRKKLESHTDAARLIQTVRGEGYILASKVDWTGPQTD